VSSAFCVQKKVQERIRREKTGGQGESTRPAGEEEFIADILKGYPRP